MAIGKIFWVEKKQNKARKFFSRATELDKDNGDTWLHLLAFEKAFGDKNSVQKVKEDFIKADPRHGELWSEAIKDIRNWRKDKFDVINTIEVSLPKY